MNEDSVDNIALKALNGVLTQKINDAEAILRSVHMNHPDELIIYYFKKWTNEPKGET